MVVLDPGVFILKMIIPSNFQQKSVFLDEKVIFVIRSRQIIHYWINRIESAFFLASLFFYQNFIDDDFRVFLAGSFSPWVFFFQYPCESIQKWWFCLLLVTSFLFSFKHVTALSRKRAENSKKERSAYWMISNSYLFGGKMMMCWIFVHCSLFLFPKFSRGKKEQNPFHSLLFTLSCSRAKIKERISLE